MITSTCAFGFDTEISGATGDFPPVLSSDLCKRLQFSASAVILFGFGKSPGRVVKVRSSRLSASLRRRPSVRWESGNPGFGFPFFHGTPVLPYSASFASE
jgi:hypothetical protein